MKESISSISARTFLIAVIGLTVVFTGVALYAGSVARTNQVLKEELNAEKLKNERLLSEKLLIEKDVVNVKAKVNNLEYKIQELDSIIESNKNKIEAAEKELEKVQKKNFVRTSQNPTKPKKSAVHRLG